MFEHLESRRLMAAGQLDPSFGVGGRAVFPFVNGRMIGAQPHGGVIVQHYVPGDVNVADLHRLDPAGAADPAFADVAPKFPRPDTIGTLDVSTVDGRIAYTSAGNAVITVHVLRADGTPDPTFDGDGALTLPADFYATGVQWHGSGLLLFAADQATLKFLRIQRLTAGGAADKTFAAGGEFQLPIDSNSLWFNSSAIGGDGSIFLSRDTAIGGGGGGGGSTATVTTRALMTKLTPSGAIDAGYGEAGTASVNEVEAVNQISRTIAFDVAADGTAFHIMHVMENGDKPPLGVKFTRLAANGARMIEKGFAFDAASSSYLGPIVPQQIETQPDGKILLIGNSTTSPGAWAIVRLNGDGNRDTAYGDNGVFTSDIARPEATRPAPVLADGDVILAGRRLTPTGTVEAVRVDAGNVELPARLNRRGTLLVNASDAGENVSIYIRNRDGRLIVRIDDFAQSFTVTKVRKIGISTFGGDDTITIGAGIIGTYVDAGDGRDTINGGQFSDILAGGTGSDRIFGFDGNDTLLGGGGNDYLLGGAGKDHLFGNAGVDTLSGAGGHDRLFGGSEADKIFGGAGDDSAAQSDEDDFTDIETLLEL